MVARVLGVLAVALLTSCRDATGPYPEYKTPDCVLVYDLTTIPPSVTKTGPMCGKIKTGEVVL